MSWWNPKSDTVELHWPTNYFFEYELKDTSVDTFSIFDGENKVAVIEWRLFRGKELVEEGERRLWMHERRAHEIMFIYGRRKALKHIQTWENEVNFPLEEGVVYEAKSSMIIDRKLVEAYDFE